MASRGGDSKSSREELDVENRQSRDMHPFLKLIILSVGFLTDAYELFVMGIIIVILHECILPNLSYPPKQRRGQSSFVATSILMGAAAGQLFFGTLGDKVGRKVMFVTTMTVIVIFTLCAACSPTTSNGPYLALSVFNLCLGFGIGGEYPLSATLASESSPPEKRGRNMSFVFSMQGVGNLLAPVIVSLILLFPVDLEWVWRIALGVAAIPCALSAYHRLRLQESSRYKKARTDSLSLRQTLHLLNQCKLHLLGTAGTWFLFDITFYGNGLFKVGILTPDVPSNAKQETVIELLGLSGGETPHDVVQNTALSSLAITIIALPGYFLAIPLTEILGRKKIQLIGFAMVAILFAIMAGAYNTILELPALFIIIYGLTFFWSNLGPNTTTFVIPGEVFTSEIRATCHGLSAAAGKVGAMLGTIAFEPVSEATSYRVTFAICSGIAILGFLMTIACIPETMAKRDAQDVSPLLKKDKTKV
ncbi:major facilitator superfamily protein [Pelomyxa schiedti]|nr:major facilitator superfamily protein [Pelomyxa schiedti]